MTPGPAELPKWPKSVPTKTQILFRLNLDARSVPEALVNSFRILTPLRTRRPPSRTPNSTQQKSRPNFHLGLKYSSPQFSKKNENLKKRTQYSYLWTRFFLEGIGGSGGFRRVRSGVRIRKLLTRASGTLLASRLGRH